MFLRILRSNPVLLLVLSILMACGIWLWIAFSPARQSFYTNTNPIFNVFFGWLVNLPFINVLIGLVFVLLQAFFWNAFVNNNTLLKQSTYFTAFFFVLLASCRPSLICPYPAMFASLFLMLAMRRLTSSYKKDKALSEVFDAGLFIGIASLFYVPAVVFLLFLWISVLIMRSLAWREWIVAVIGFALPFGFAMAYYTLFFTPEKFWYEKLLMAFGSYRFHWSFNWKQWLLIIALVSSSIAALWVFFNKLTDNVLKAQKVWTLMLWFIFFGIVSMAISPERDGRSLAIVIAPMSFVFANYFLKAKSKVWPEFLFLVLLIAIGVNIIL